MKKAIKIALFLINLFAVILIFALLSLNAATVTYQAENATYGGSVVTETTNTGYNGTSYLNFPASGGYVQFNNVDGGSGGAATLRFRNALGATSSRTGRFQVNGGTWQNITFNPTGAWTTWVGTDVGATLTSGTTNTIRLESTGQDIANVDELTVISGSSSTPTPTLTARVTPTPTRPGAPTPTPTTITATPTATVRSVPTPTNAPYTESLDRGLTAVKVSAGVFLSWRLLKKEVTGYSSTGLTGTDFNVYRDGAKIATVTNSTNYQDNSGTTSSRYYVRAVMGGAEVDTSATASPWSNTYYDLPIQKPAGVTLPDGVTPSYSANDMSVGDVDGDGQYEYFVKWDPSNSQDVIGKGYTGNVYIDCYKLNGTRLWRIDMGPNIRAGAHYTQYMVYDFNGDGKAEIIMKTAPGTKTGTGAYITMLAADTAAGYKNTDDYRSTNTSFYNHLVDVFKNWRNHPEVVNGHWSNTLEACFGIANKYNYPLSDTDARALVDYFMDTYAPSRSSNNALRSFTGYIFSGPEYLTIFNGATGAEMQTIAYKPGRDDDGLMWGDYAMSRIEPCNRVERMGATVAYLDGVKPYAVFCRGYYTRSTLTAYSWDGTNLREYWFVDSGYPVMSNPFNSNPHGMDGRNSAFAKITTQGAHTVSSADVDGDGCDEIIYGAATIDHNGNLLYSSFAPLNGVSTRLGHGDSIHVADIIPSRPGMEIFMCHEGGTAAPYGISMRDARTGATLWGTYKGSDNGRCMIGDLDPARNGIENWSMALRAGDSAGTQISTSMPGTNFNIKWGADMTTQVVNGSGTSTPTINGWTTSNTSTTVLTCSGTYTNNSTKGNPCLVADVFGDFREELLLRTTDSSAIRIYTNTAVTTHKLFTLMNDRKYRLDIASQNDGYNQPAYPSFYYAGDINWQTLFSSL